MLLVLFLICSLGTGFILTYLMCGIQEHNLVSLAHITSAVASIVLTAYKIAFPEHEKHNRRRR